MDFTKFLPWSPSKADKAIQCGLAFKFQYIDKIKSTARSPAAKVGVTLHKIIELMLVDNISANAAIERLLEKDKDLLHTEKEDIYRQVENLESFIRKLNNFDAQYKIRKRLTEFRGAIAPNFESCNYYDSGGMMRGIIDLVLVLENGYLIILDHKTGKLKDLSSFTAQLDIYTLVAYATFPNVKGVQTAINFLAYDHIMWGPKRSTQYIEEKLRPWLHDYLNKCTEGLENFTPNVSKLCDWCDFRNLCPEYGETDGRDTEEKAGKVE